MKNKLFSYLNSLLFYSPCLCLFLIWTFILLAWTQTDVFPPESGIDPKIIQNWIGYLYLPSVVASVIMPFAAWLIVGYNLIRMFRKKDCLSKLGLSALQLVGVKIIIFLDPGHALGWIID